MPHFVNLERTFRPFAEAIGQDSEFAKAWYGLVEDGQTWDELLEKKRVVILAEAGAGKTHEMRTTAKKLIGDGKAAFFIDITDLSNAPINEILLRDDKTRFEAWMKSNDDGWFLLDSVDEARLASFRNFKNALRGLARSIERHLGRAHIFISCRVSDWHAHSDRALVADMLPIPLKSSTDGGVINQDLPLTSQKDDKRPEDDVYLAELQELSKTQMQRYALAQDGINAKAFMRALEEADAYRFAERPLDLDEIIGYWREHNRIGSHAEMIEFNIEKKLIEHKAERRREQPLSADNALQGVTVLAAGLTFTKLNSIRLPDDTPAPELGDKAIRAEDILTDWNSNEIQSLLTRPIFDNATYGRVRFHHRSVREYLTAKWLKNLLQKGRSRRPVKSLFFTKRYGLDIVVPSMQPIVAWLAIENEQIRNQTLAIAPEILINYGDPSQFPVDFRERMLRNIVTLHNTPESRLSFDVSAVRRFASSDLASVLIELLESQPVNLDLRHLLLRVIWQGGLSDCAGIALSYALDSSMDPSTKHYAILAVSATGDTEQKTKLIKAIMANLKAWRKDAVGIFVEEFFPEMLSVDDLFKILKTFPDHDEFDSSRLSYYLEKLPILRLLTDDYLKILDWIFHQVNAPRLKEPNYSVTANEIHLMRAAMKIIAHLMGKAFLDDEGGYPESVLELFEYAATITYHGRNVSDGVIPEFVQSHKGLRHELFWRGVQRSRANLQKKGKHFRNYLQMPFEYKICKLPYDDFPYFLQEINNKEFADDRHVAFSAAYAIWWRTSSDKKDLERLQDAVSEHPKLVNLLAKKNRREWTSQPGTPSVEIWN